MPEPLPAARPVLATPPCGRLRRLAAADARHLAAHLLRLHPEDRRHRFMGAMPRQLVHRYVRSLNWHRAVLVGCFVGRSLRGVGELHPIGGRRGEIALSVERRFQRRGIGERLLGHILILARNRGLASLELRCTVDNQRIRRLVRKFDAATAIDAAEAAATIHPLPPTPATWVTELAEHAGTLIRFWLDAAGNDRTGRRAA